MMKHRSILVVLFAGSMILSCRGPEGPAGPVGPAGSGGVESLTDPTIRPRVLATYPPANGVGPFDLVSNQLTVRFNKIMDRSTMHHAFTLSAAGTNVRIDTNSIRSIGDDLFFVSPVDSPRKSSGYRWRVGATYALGVNSKARDVNGNYLSPSFSMAFNPEPNFRVRSVYPANGASELYGTVSLAILLNAPVDTSFFSKIHIQPAIPGEWEADYPYDSTYLNYSTMNAMYKVNTVYTVTIDADARDRDGHQLQQPFSWSFSTASFRVTFTYPSDGTPNVSPAIQMQIVFTDRIDTGTVRRAIAIDPNLPGGFLLSYEPLVLSPVNGLRAETTYTVTIDTSLHSISGVSLAARSQFSFTTAPFRVTDTFPFDGQLSVGLGSGCTVYLNAQYDSGTVRSAFNLADSAGRNVAGEFILADRGMGFGFTPLSELTANMQYRGTINTNLRAASGSRLKSTYTFLFTTGN